MEERPKQVAEERVNQNDKSFLEIGQEVSLLVKASAFRFSEAFWDKVPLKWHSSVKLVLKLCLVTILIVIAFSIGWQAAKSKYSQREDSAETDIFDDETDKSVGGECSHIKADESDCASYYSCEGGYFHHKHCPKFHHYDPQKEECVWIHLSSCGNDAEDEIDVVPVDGAVPTLSQALAEEEELTSMGDINMMKARLITLPSEDVELVLPGRSTNPTNTKLVESIIREKDWEFMFPSRHPSYSYTNFLKAISKFPAVCSADAALCRKVLATMFAHFTQETGAHDPSLQVPQWRQGLAHLEEVGCDSRDCGYSSTCGTSQWTAVAWPCGKDSGGGFLSYHGRGAKQLSYNYNYGQFSAAMYGDTRYLLDNPELVADTWLNLASAVWFFSTPQPPKPSMLGVVEGDWKPNQADLASGLRPGFGLTTNIINGGIECGKGTETQQARNRVDYYRKFAKYLGVQVEGELGCGRMKKFGSAGTSAGAVATYWEQNWSIKYKCKLVTYQTPYSALVQGDYVKCVQEKFKIKLA